LLALLATQAMDEVAGLGASSGKAAAGSASWRVGVHLPVKGNAEITEHAAAMAADNHHNTQVRVRTA
jgi:hypothetical protein